MNKILYVNGCSWSAGNGIEYDPSLLESNKSLGQKKYNWGSVLANKLNRQCINESQGAGSNKRMVRTTCDFLQSINESEYKNLIVILGWTTIDRSEIFLSEDGQEQWCAFNGSQTVSSHSPPFSKNFLKKIDQYQKDYITLVYNLKINYLEFFQEMYLMKNLLENLKIKYLFFNSLPWRKAWPDTFRVEEEYKSKILKIKSPNILSTRDCDDSLNVMAEFCRINKLPMAPDHHTMIDGHKKWAEHLHDELNKIYQEI